MEILNTTKEKTDTEIIFGKYLRTPGATYRSNQIKIPSKSWIIFDLRHNRDAYL